MTCEIVLPELTFSPLAATELIVMYFLSRISVKVQSQILDQKILETFAFTIVKTPPTILLSFKEKFTSFNQGEVHDFQVKSFVA